MSLHTLAESECFWLYLKNMNMTFSLVASVCMNPFMVKELFLLFFFNYNDRNHPNVLDILCILKQMPLFLLYYH